jgi:hypothetical protein
MEIEAAESDALLHVNPHEAASLEVGSAAAGDFKIPSVADLNRDLRIGENLVERVGEHHVPAVVKHHIGDHAVHELVILLVAKHTLRLLPGVLIQELKLGAGNWVAKDGLVVVRGWNLGLLGVGLRS